MEKLKKIQETAYTFLQIVVSFLMLFSFVMIFSTKSHELQSRFAFISAQSLGFIVCSFAPHFFKYGLKICFPPLILLVFLFYLILHFLCGEIMNFYVLVKHYDSLLHFSSSIMLAFLAYSMILSFHHGPLPHPWFIFFFCVCFAMACGYVWELLEYLIDDIFQTNMQRYMNDSTKEYLIGHRALTDTMKDMFLNCLGAICSSFYIKIKGVRKKEYFYISLKKDVS